MAEPRLGPTHLLNGRLRAAIRLFLADFTDTVVPMEFGVEAVRRDPAPWAERTYLTQRWDELAYFHWRYDPADVQALLPEGLRVDTCDGSAWVGLIPFEMRRVRILGTPPVPYLSSFLEINVRTYVIDRTGRRAVWFFSLDVPRTAIVGVARTVFALPYCWAATSHEVDGNRHTYAMQRRWPHRARPAARMVFEVGGEYQPDELDDFLTARWGLVTQRGNRLLHGAVTHERWPLHTVSNVQVEQNALEAAGLPSPVAGPLARYSPGVDVELGWLRPIGAAR